MKNKFLFLLLYPFVGQKRYRPNFREVENHLIPPRRKGLYANARYCGLIIVVLRLAVLLFNFPTRNPLSSFSHRPTGNNFTAIFIAALLSRFKI